jgi:hypothetical protein
MVRSHLQQEWGISSADETKNIIGKGLIVHQAQMIMFLNQQEMRELELFVLH